MALKNQAKLIKIIDAVECMEKCLSCAICLEISSNPVETRCGHLFCRTCIKKLLNQPGESCPVCKSNLSRRTVSSSDQMELCIKQLSKLSKAICEDTGIDITSCMKTHYKKTAFLPSVHSSPQSQQNVENQLTSIESYKVSSKNDDKSSHNNDENECAISEAKQDISCLQKSSTEYKFYPLKEPSNNNISCKLITTRSKLKEIPSRSTATTSNPSPVQNENLIPETITNIENKSKFALEDSETRQFNSNANDQLESYVDQSFDESRQCLRDISACNQNQSLSDQSIKTWSRVAKFGKELRRKSKKKNSPRLHKKDKLCVNLRDRNCITNSISDSSLDREKSDPHCVNVDHDANTNISIVDRHEDKINVSDDQMNKDICDKANSTNCNRDDETVLKNKEALIYIIGKNDVNVASERSKLGKQSLEEEELMNVVSEKSVSSVNKANKLYEEKGKLTNVSLKDDLEKEKTSRRANDKINQVLEIEGHKVVRTKRTQYVDPAEKVVSFKKLGHLFKEHRRRVPFLYLGRMKDRLPEVYRENGSSSICKLCSSSRLPHESSLMEKSRTESINHLNRSKSFESSNFLQQRYKNLPNRLNILPSIAQNNDANTRIESNRTNSFLENQAASKSRMISSKNHSPFHSSADGRSPLGAAEIADKNLPDQMMSVENCSQSRIERSQFELTEVAETASPDQRKSSESSIFKRKRKASESPDGNQCSKKQTECVYREVSCTELYSQHTLPSLPRVQEMDITDLNKSLERENVDRGNDFQEQNKLPQANITFRNQSYHRESMEPMLVITSKCEKVLVDPSENDLQKQITELEANISVKGTEGSKRISIMSPDVPKIVNSKERRDIFGLQDNLVSRTHSANVAQNAESNECDAGSEMNLSEASMMDITGQEILLKKFEEQLFGGSENKGQRNRDENRDEDNNSSSSAVENAVSPKQLNQSVEEPRTDLVERNRSQESDDFMDLTPTEQNIKNVDDPLEFFRSKDIVAIRPKAEKPQKRKQEKSAKTKSSNTKIRPLYQSTPNSSHRVPITRYPLNVCQQNEPVFSTDLKNNEILRSSKFSTPERESGCILCSGLTSKQSDEVRYLSRLFNMRYTKEFSNDVTHVIVRTNDDNNGACKTLKYLQGVAYKKWVLNFNWVVDCMSQGKLLNEEMYEVVDSTTLIPGPKNSRIQKNALFEDFTFLCVEPLQNISVSDYEDLLRQMGATVVESLDELAAEKSIFKIIAVQAECHENKIIGWHQITKAVPVAQEWIVECISQYRCVSLLPFLQELVPQDVLDLGFPEELIQDDDIYSSC